jgi:hypothetical protein
MSTAQLAAAAAANTGALQAIDNGSPLVLTMIYDRFPIRDFGVPTSAEDLPYALYADLAGSKVASLPRTLPGMPLSKSALPTPVVMAAGASLKRRSRVKTQRKPATLRRLDASVEDDKENAARAADPALVGSRQMPVYLRSQLADDRRRVRDWEAVFGDD